MLLKELNKVPPICELANEADASQEERNGLGGEPSMLGPQPCAAISSPTKKYQFYGGKNPPATSRLKVQKELEPNKN